MKKEMTTKNAILGALAVIATMFGCVFTLGAGFMLVDKNPWWSLFGIPLALVGFIGMELWRIVDKDKCKICHPDDDMK